VNIAQNIYHLSMIMVVRCLFYSENTLKFSCNYADCQFGQILFVLFANLTDICNGATKFSRCI